MFLVGGPAFSGTTLLAHLLNQEGIVCMDEPDFHDPRQNHRSIPVLQQLFPHCEFPARPEKKLSYRAAFTLISQCQERILPTRLGIKTANWIFIRYARIFRRAGHPVIAITRDIRDALVSPLPDWISERRLNKAYRLIWKNRDLYDYCCRYEDLVAHPEEIMAGISTVLQRELRLQRNWNPDEVQPQMIKLQRHRLLQQGAIESSRVGIWKDSGRTFTRMSHRTASMMGYGA